MISQRKKILKYKWEIMKWKNYAIGIFYNKQHEILVQDRRSWIDKPTAAWWLFWWGVEEWETFTQWLEREILEELHIEIKNYYEVGRTVVTEIWGKSQECRVYMASWEWQDISNFRVDEWAWSEIVTIEDFKQRDTFPWIKLCLEMFDWIDEDKLLRE